MSERETSYEFDNSEANELLQAKVECLRLASKMLPNPSPDEIVKAARKFYDFIAYEPEAENEQG